MRWISNQWKLQKLKKATRDADNFYMAESGKAKREKKNPDETREILEEAVVDVFYARDQLAAHRSVMLQNKAQGYGIPSPALEDKSAWEGSSVDGRRYLTTKAMADLRSA